MNWTDLKKMPFVTVNREGHPEENILIRDRCETCKRHTQPALCPAKCGRFNEPAPFWTGPGFYKSMEAEAVERYQEMYPEYCQQLELF